MEEGNINLFLLTFLAENDGIEILSHSMELSQPQLPQHAASTVLF